MILLKLNDNIISIKKKKFKQLKDFVSEIPKNLINILICMKIFL